MATGRADIGFMYDGSQTRLAHLNQSDPLRILFPDVADDEPVTGALVTTSGGLVGGDSLGISVRGAADTASRIVGQAAEKVYRSLGADVTIEVKLDASDGAWLEWLPQETILFENARMRRATLADVGAGARMMAGEMIVFGRTAMGETMTSGLVRDAWEVRRGGRLVWSDALHLDTALHDTLQSAAGLDGASAYASMIYVADDASNCIDAARELLGEPAQGLHAAATCVGDVLIVRWIGDDSLSLRNAYGDFWCGFRNRIAGYPAQMPRLWNM